MKASRVAVFAGCVLTVLAVGFRAMPSHAAQVPPEDRWRAIAYIRSLQGGSQP